MLASYLAVAGLILYLLSHKYKDTVFLLFSGVLFLFASIMGMAMPSEFYINTLENYTYTTINNQTVVDTILTTPVDLNTHVSTGLYTMYAVMGLFIIIQFIFMIANDKAGKSRLQERI